MHFGLGIDIACRAAHQASLADERGEFIWSGRSFRTRTVDLEGLWAMLPRGVDPVAVTVVMEPTRNVWVPLAAWFRRQGATVVLVPPERAADLRAYYAKHTTSDRLDSRLLARLPCSIRTVSIPSAGLGPEMPCAGRRSSTRRSSCVAASRSPGSMRCSRSSGPAGTAAFQGDLVNKTPLRFLATGYADPDTVRRLRRARLGRFFARHSRGMWGEAKADELLAAAAETHALWAGDLDYPELAVRHAWRSP